MERTAEAEWKGSIKEGGGKVKLGSGAFEGPYSFSSRFESAKGTNPEELLGAAHAGCFTMALSLALTTAGHAPERIHTTARVHINRDETGFAINKIELATEVSAPGLDDAKLQELARGAKQNCPLSRALSAVPTITLAAKLV
jgi:osmotically inducible protein OsmC